MILFIFEELFISLSRLFEVGGLVQDLLGSLLFGKSFTREKGFFGSEEKDGFFFSWKDFEGLKG